MKRTYRLFVLPLFIGLLLISGLTPIKHQPLTPYAVPDPVRGEKGMVVSAHPEATKAGLDILQKGGNAVDAAVATGFALAVVYPVAGNIGGGGFMVIRDKNGKSTSFDYREKAPEAATRDMFLDEKGNFVATRSTKGYLANGVPGAVAGMLQAHAKQGKLPLSAVLAPAIRLASMGWRLTEQDADMFNHFYKDFAEFKSTAKYFTKGSPEKPYSAGELFTQKDLALTLRRIQIKGHDGFYKGPTADLLVAEMKRGGGLITHKDLASYQAQEREVVTGTYRGYKIISMAPPSSGGIALMQLLNAVEPYDIKEMGFRSSELIHLEAEAMRRVYADRAEWLGDPDFFNVPQKGLIAKRYMQERMKTFDPQKATPSAQVKYGNPAMGESTETTHYSVVDKDGNAVAVTTTINGAFGNFVVVDGAGFFLNNEMDDFSAKPGTPNMFGVIGGEANAIQPHKRMLSSMTPTIVADPEGRLFMVAGSPGGSTIITTVYQVMTNVIDHGMNIAEAVSVPRIHHQWLPEVLFHEKWAFPIDVSKNLESKGWKLSQRAGTSGMADCILITHETISTKTDPSGINTNQAKTQKRVYWGGADPRGQSLALGY